MSTRKTPQQKGWDTRRLNKARQEAAAEAQTSAAPARPAQVKPLPTLVVKAAEPATIPMVQRIDAKLDELTELANHLADKAALLASAPVFPTPFAAQGGTLGVQTLGRLKKIEAILREVDACLVAYLG